MKERSVRLPEGQSPPALQAFRKSLARYVTNPIIAILAKTPLTPNALTVISSLVTIAAAVLVAMHHPVAGALVVLFASGFDMLDGALARATGRVTKFGAALDSTLDRLSDGVVFIGLMWFYSEDGSSIGVLLAAAAMVTSFLVSYSRARAEGLGLECQVGIFTRAERIIILVLGLLLSGVAYVLTASLLVIIVLSAITTGQRLFLVWQKTKQ
jgi:CDP-diacylglycerol--glycerol-3-phosphate 3-phosphatidyltransferase